MVKTRDLILWQHWQPKARLCYYDLSKGFDRVDHNILIDIQQQLYIHPSILSCIRSFLTGRQQRVCINGHMSSWKHDPAGIPRGNVLQDSRKLRAQCSVDSCWPSLDNSAIDKPLSVLQALGNLCSTWKELSLNENSKNVFSIGGHILKIGWARCTLQILESSFYGI